MTRDRKLNPWQKTPGEIKRASVSPLALLPRNCDSRHPSYSIVKAGGFSKLKSKIAGLKA